MALKFAIQTVFEFAVVVLIIYGFWHEDKLIAFEDDLKAKILNRKETKRNRKSDDSKPVRCADPCCQAKRPDARKRAESHAERPCRGTRHRA